MRLINTKTLELHEFFDSDVPPYAILSHRWEQDEVSYQDMLKSKKKDGAGYAKIRDFCAVALRDCFRWAWVDTCCIDKKSSADLTEAINAMFRWYKDSNRCYAYLSDVKRVRDETGKARWPHFKQSKWFTRGWTLQELIAPSELVFFDCYWHQIGTRSAMLEKVTAATGIPRRAFGFWHRCSVAQRMSWASQRETSRVEDIAYCLLGLFDIKMPLLYGEGMSAFRRLQEEIIKTSSDETLFVWSDPAPTSERKSDAGLLATSPASFASCGEVKDTYCFWRKPYSMTNKGLKLSTSLYIDPQSRRRVQPYLIPLNCCLYSSVHELPMGSQRLELAMEVETYRLDTEHTGYSRLGWREMPAEAERVERTTTIYLSVGEV